MRVRLGQAVRDDLFRDRKGVHIKLKKEVHAGFRTKLFEHGISMQKVLNEFARLVACGDHRAMMIIKNLCKRELQAEIDKMDKVKRHEEDMNELDQEALYDLIEGSDDDNHQDIV
jgi:hypothetical protein